MASSPQQEATCFERIGTGTYNSMAAHPDGSGRIFLSTQGGEVWLARGSGGALQIYDSPFLDLTDRVLWLVGIAFHPEFATNNRFFVSYTCDSNTTPTCGTNSCSSAAGNGSMPSQYHLVVAEFSAKGGNDYSKATHADPAEVRRLFSMGLPQQPDTSYSQHGGQILFQPTDYDGYLYLVAGHGGETDLSEDNRSFYGNIIRFDVDNSTPLKPQIFAVGLTDPRGCSFGPERPSNLYCANVDQQLYQRVYSISNMTGTYGGSTSNISSLVVIDHGRPTAGSVPSIVGGLFYRGLANPSMNGRYLYMYGSAAQAAMVVTPESSLPFATSPIQNIWCSGSTPCRGGVTSISGLALFLGEDNSKDAFILTTDGVYRLVDGRLCSIPPPQTSSQSPHRSLLGTFKVVLLFIAVSIAVPIVVGVVPQILQACWNRNAAGEEIPAPQPPQVVVNNYNGVVCIQMANINHQRHGHREAS